MRASANILRNVAIAEGIYLPSFTAYPNYAISDTAAEDLYGDVNVGRLREIRAKVDPKRVMDLAGGFEI